MDPNLEPSGYKPPTSAEELLERYARGERSFPRARLIDQDLREANLRNSDLVDSDLSGSDARGVSLQGARLLRSRFVRVNFGEADLSRARLDGADFSWANLSHARLDSAFASGARFVRARMVGTSLREFFMMDGDFTEANLDGAQFQRARLYGVNLADSTLRRAFVHGSEVKAATMVDADLRGASLRDSVLCACDLSRAILDMVVLERVRLERSTFAGTSFGGTTLDAMDLSECVGLERASHSGPSSATRSTLVLSRGRIPASFLRGCGLVDWEIEAVRQYDPDLTPFDISELQYKVFDLRVHSVIQLSPIFIAYCHEDAAFVDHVAETLDGRRIRHWRDTHDAVAGRLDRQIDRAIRLNPTVLLVLSKNSVCSDWVEWEATRARGLEKELGRDVLCPVALDDSWKTCDWPSPLRQQIMKYNILDLSNWRDPAVFDRQFRRLLDGLALFYKPEPKRENG